MKAISLQSALDNVEKLEVKLSDFAKKHQSEIQNDPVFRERYVRVWKDTFVISPFVIFRF